MHDPASPRHVSREAEDRSLIAEPLLESSHPISLGRGDTCFCLVAHAATMERLLRRG
jgi:hypothetical protein